MNLICYADYVNSSIKEQISFAKVLKINNIILRKLNDLKVYDLTDLEIKELTTNLRKDKINLFALDPELKSELYYQSETIENYIKTIDVASSLKVENIFLRLPKVVDILTEFETLKVHLDEILHHAKLKKITILIKQEEINNNVLAYIMNKYHERYLSIIFSPKDAILSKDSAISGYRILKQYFNTFVAADLDTKNNPELLGYGRVDIINLFKRMKRDKYQGNIILDDSFIKFFNNEEIKKVPLLKKLFKSKSIKDQYLTGYKLRIFSEDHEGLPDIYDIYLNQINVLNVVFN